MLVKSALSSCISVTRPTASGLWYSCRPSLAAMCPVYAADSTSAYVSTTLCAAVCARRIETAGRAQHNRGHASLLPMAAPPNDKHRTQLPPWFSSQGALVSNSEEVLLG